MSGGGLQNRHDLVGIVGLEYLSLLKNELKTGACRLAISRGSTLVAMMQTADLREGEFIPQREL